MMGLYFYEVVDRMGRSGSGQMAADDEMIVAEKLRDMGLTVLDINKVRQSSLSTLFKRKPKVGIGDLALFSRQLQTLLEAGIPLTRGLYTLSNQVANRGFSEVLSEIAQHVDSGMSFSDALSNHSGVFPSLFVNMIRSGEASGNLDEILTYSRQVTPNKAAQALAIASFLSSKTYKIFCTKRRKTPLKNLIG
jgi:type IV pilus assembly protein PilC